MTVDGYKHYIRTNEAGIVVHGFSDAFEQPQAGDRLISDDAGRHFQLQLMNERGQYRYKLEDNELVDRTQTELDSEWASRPAPPPSLTDEIANLKKQNANFALIFAKHNMK